MAKDQDKKRSAKTNKPKLDRQGREAQEACQEGQGAGGRRLDVRASVRFRALRRSPQAPRIRGKLADGSRSGQAFSGVARLLPQIEERPLGVAGGAPRIADQRERSQPSRSTGKRS